ncbi:MAG: terminase, partial [Proteobacteria bacterium]|nr:terminase [Pseudomonadota bacterium]
LRKVVWKELADGLEVLYNKLPWLEGYFRKEAKAFFAVGYKDNWFAIPVTAPKNEPENVAGQHREKYTALCDEASKLPDELIDVLKGALTGKDNSFAMISQGTRPNGHFYDSHHSKRDLYTRFRFDAELSPLVTKRWIREKLLEYGGFHATEYQIRVKGAFPDQIEGRLIARSWAEGCGDIRIEHKETPGIVILVDVSGYGHDKTVYLVAKVSGYDEARTLETVELRIHSGVS